MAHKVLGQAAPAATTNTDLYTVPAGKSAVCSSLVVCNLSNSATSGYRVAVRPGGAAITNAHYLIYGAGLTVNSSDFLTIGITLAEGDVVTIWAETTELSFSLFGNEA